MNNKSKYPCGLAQKMPNFCKGKKCASCNLNDQKDKSQPSDNLSSKRNEKHMVKVTLTERHIKALQDAIDAMSNYANLTADQNESIDLIADLIATTQAKMVENGRQKS